MPSSVTSLGSAMHHDATAGPRTVSWGAGVRRAVNILVVLASLAAAAWVGTPPAVASVTAPAPARWTPDAARYGIAVTNDVPVTMPDGRVLRAAIHAPTGPPHRPARRRALPRAPHPHAPTASRCPTRSTRTSWQGGYLGVAVDVCGTGGSDGAVSAVRAHRGPGQQGAHRLGGPPCRTRTARSG